MLRKVNPNVEHSNQISRTSCFVRFLLKICFFPVYMEGDKIIYRLFSWKSFIHVTLSFGFFFLVLVLGFITSGLTGVVTSMMTNVGLDQHQLNCILIKVIFQMSTVDLLSTLYAVLISCLCLVLPSILRHQSNIQRDIIETNTFQLLFSIFAFGDLTSTKLYLFFFSIQEHHKLVKSLRKVYLIFFCSFSWNDNRSLHKFCCLFVV